MATPILLGNASWTGTLAAVRVLGRAGIPVTVMDDRRLPHSRFSRHATRFVRCPAPVSGELVDWLLDFGRREPGTVLYPTSDSLAYLYALHQERLEQVFSLSLPPLSAVLAVLDKKQLYAAAQQAGLSTPETWFPDDQSDVDEITRWARAPVVVKPRTQVLSLTMGKGAIVRDLSKLRGAVDRFVATNTYAPELSRGMPQGAFPIVQAYHPEAAEEIYLLAGFSDESTGVFAVRASLKVLQWPRRLGIGLCFEDAEVMPELVDGVKRLCRATGYRGLFQIEFIRTGGRHLLIDFNPRFYHPLAFEVARGLPLPLMVYASACGRKAWLRELAEEAGRPYARRYTAFCNSFGLNVMLTTQALMGTMPAQQASKWRSWYVGHNGHCIDSHSDPQDPLPSVAFAADELYRYARHPLSFFRTIVLNR